MSRKRKMKSVRLYKETGVRFLNPGGEQGLKQVGREKSR